MKYTYSTKKGVGTMKIEYKKKAVKYRLRVGNLRVLFTFQNDIITINEIRPRGKAYKRL